MTQGNWLKKVELFVIIIIIIIIIPGLC